MAGEIEICTGMDPFDFLPSDRECVFDVNRRICVVSKFHMVMVPIVFRGETQ